MKLAQVAEEFVRTPIPDDVAAEVLFQHDRICCVCNEPGKAVQIHHIDEDPSHHSQENLAVLCLQHHEETQIGGGFSRKLRAVDVRKHRDEWTRRVRERRVQVDKIVVEKLAAITVEQKEAGTPRPEGQPFRYRPSTRILELYLSKIPDMITDAYTEGEEAVRDGDSKDAVAAARLIVGVLEQILVQLSKWVDPEHFEARPLRDYYSEFLAERNRWNRLLIEPKDYGTRARTGTIETLERTVVDLRMTVFSLVTALGKAYLKDFDPDEWAANLPKPTRFWTTDI